MNSNFAHIVRAKWIRLSLLTLAVAIVFFNLVNPAEGSSFVAIVGCLLLIGVVYSLLRLIMDVVAFFVSVSEQVRKRLAVALTMVAAYLIVMQSIGQLSMRDVLAVVPLAAVLYFYLSYSAAKQR